MSEHLIKESREWLDMLSVWVKKRSYDQDCLIAFCQQWDKSLSAYESQHDLYKSGDQDIPRSILNASGDVVLGLCKKCGKGESDLTEACSPDTVQLSRAEYEALKRSTERVARQLEIAILPDPHDERDISVDWLKGQVRKAVADLRAAINMPANGEGGE
jgi:hypothetical protein